MILDGIGEYLEQEIDALTFSEAAGGNVFVDTLPQAPDTAVGIYYTGGAEASSKDPEDLPNVQIIVRGTADPRTGLGLWHEIYSVLHGLRNVTLPDGEVIIYCLAIQSAPVPIGPDEKQRRRYSMNLRCMIDNVTSQRT